MMQCATFLKEMKQMSMIAKKSYIFGCTKANNFKIILRLQTTLVQLTIYGASDGNIQCKTLSQCALEFNYHQYQVRLAFTGLIPLCLTEMHGSPIAKRSVQNSKSQRISCAFGDFYGFHKIQTVLLDRSCA